MGIPIPDAKIAETKILDYLESDIRVVIVKLEVEPLYRFPLYMVILTKLVNHQNKVNIHSHRSGWVGFYEHVVTIISEKGALPKIKQSIVCS